MKGHSLDEWGVGWGQCEVAFTCAQPRVGPGPGANRMASKASSHLTNVLVAVRSDRLRQWSWEAQ